MTRKNLFAIIGFSMFIIGFLALVLMMVGVKLSFLTWIDAPGRLFGFIARLLMIIVGIMIIYFSQTNWRQEEAI